MARIPQWSDSTMQARRAMVNRVNEIPIRDWVLLPSYTDMALFMNELVDGAFDASEGGPATQMTNLYWNPSVNLEYACDTEQDPITAYFEMCAETSRGPHDIVAVRECSSQWIGTVHMIDFRDQRDFKVVNIAGDMVVQRRIDHGVPFTMSHLVPMVIDNLCKTSANVNGGTKLVLVFEDKIIDVDADLQQLRGKTILDRRNE